MCYDSFKSHKKPGLYYLFRKYTSGKTNGGEGCQIDLPNIKNRTYYYLIDIINIDKFNPKNIKVGTKFYKDILIFYTVYETLDCVTLWYIDFDR